MAAVYKTPGVYVEEIPKFPPSIAPVETAIPAFIGYTEKAIRNGESLFNKPTRIESIAEYEEIFGKGPSQDVTVTLDTNNQFVKAEVTTKLYLYDSLRMFYANGGGICYIVSVKSYSEIVSSGVTSADLEKALELLELEDEPTIILAPDAVSGSNGPYEFQKKALIQCNKLKDRITLCDLKISTSNNDFNESVTTFREKIGINFLKYGVAYGPWVRAILPRTLLRRNVELVGSVGAPPSTIQLSSLTTDEDIQSLIADLMNVENFVNDLDSDESSLAPNTSLEDYLKELLDEYNALASTSTENNVQDKLLKLTDFAVSVILKVKKHYDAASPAADHFKIKDNVDTYISNARIGSALTDMVNHHNYLSSDHPPSDHPPIDPLSVVNANNLNDVATLLKVALPGSPAPDSVTNLYSSANTPKDHGDIAVSFALSFVNEAIVLFRFMEATSNNYEKTLNEALLAAFGTYKELVTKAGEALDLLPPSGIIAGVYAAVDRDRGVWKAPANVSLNSVIGPAVKISHEQQEKYNVDVSVGKSINIIRSFIGKGTLVWGARTLAGNDNEWRYVNVRRFFNFVEESTKKATEQFVFEPNDANTWVKIQAMIENFLTTLWRQGALQGIKPEHAFYVAVGLGKTMTPLDILEGRMIVEIGMAAVRPAEFIILKFSHKMAES